MIHERLYKIFHSKNRRKREFIGVGLGEFLSRPDRTLLNLLLMNDNIDIKYDLETGEALIVFEKDPQQRVVSEVTKLTEEMYATETDVEPGRRLLPDFKFEERDHREKLLGEFEENIPNEIQPYGAVSKFSLTHPYWQDNIEYLKHQKPMKPFRKKPVKVEEQWTGRRRKKLRKPSTVHDFGSTLSFEEAVQAARERKEREMQGEFQDEDDFSSELSSEDSADEAIFNALFGATAMPHKKVHSLSRFIKADDQVSRDQQQLRPSCECKA